MTSLIAVCCRQNDAPFGLSIMVLVEWCELSYAYRDTIAHAISKSILFPNSIPDSSANSKTHSKTNPKSTPRPTKSPTPHSSSDTTSHSSANKGTNSSAFKISHSSTINPQPTAVVWKFMARRSGSSYSAISDSQLRSYMATSQIKIIYRYCSQCTYSSHRNIYYKRLTSVPTVSEYVVIPHRVSWTSSSIVGSATRGTY